MIAAVSASFSRSMDSMGAGDSTNGGIWVERLRKTTMPVHEVLELFRPELLRLASRICGEHDAEDAVQTSLLRAADRISEFRGETDARLRAWLRTIVRRQCLVQLRADGPRAALQSGHQALEFAADSGGTPSQDLRRNEEFERLTRLLGQLTPEQLEAICYRYFEEWSIAEIARQMGKTEQAVMGLLHRGLTRLRDETSPSEWSRILK